MTSLKSPRTPHLVGSGIKDSGTQRDRVDWKDLYGRSVVLEEKIDGSEVSFYFDGDANLVCRERSSVLEMDRRGGSEATFDRLKDFLLTIIAPLFDRIEDRYIVYAEWTAVLHTIFYDALPDFLIECDIQDRVSGVFLSTDRRKELLNGLPIVSAPVLFAGVASEVSRPSLLVGRSLYCHRPVEALDGLLALGGGHSGKLGAIDTSGRSEGIYGKIEEDGIVTGRFKYVREAFVRMIVDSGLHWKDRQTIPNLLKDDQRSLKGLPSNNSSIRSNTVP